MGLSPCASYVVDVMHSKSAESIAAQRYVALSAYPECIDYKCYSAFRALALSLYVATIIPTIEAYGVLVANTISAGYGLIALL